MSWTPQYLDSSTLLLNDIMGDTILILRDALIEFLKVYSYREFEILFSNFLLHIKRLIKNGQDSGKNVSRLASLSRTPFIHTVSSSSFNNEQPTTMSMDNHENNELRPLQNHSVLLMESLNCADSTGSNHFQSQKVPDPVERQSTVSGLYSNMTIISNTSVSNSQQTNNISDSCYSIELPLEDVFSNSRTYKKNVVKYLSMWSLTLELITSKLKSSKVILTLTGTLYGKDQVTVLDKCHNAGILKSRKERNLVMTQNGLYRLIGGIVGGSPYELYQACLNNDGIPRNWKHISNKLLDFEKNHNTSLHYPLDSSIKSISPTNINCSKDINSEYSTYTRNCDLVSQKTNRKRKYSQCDTIEDNFKTKFNKVDKLRMFTSTPKKQIIQPTYIVETSSEILETTSNLKDQNIKRKESNSKKLMPKCLKQFTPIKTSLSSSNGKRQSKEISINNLNILNNNSRTTHSKSIITATNNLNCSKRQYKIGLQKNTDNNDKKKFEQTQLKKIEQNIKIVKKNCPKPVKQNKNNLNNIVLLKNVSKISKSKPKDVKCSSSLSPELGLFANVDDDDYGDFNVMASPGKLSMSDADESVCEIDPLISHQSNISTDEQ